MMQRGTKRNGCFFYLTLAQLSQTKHAQQFSPCAADLRPEIRAGQIVWLDGLRPEIMDNRFHQRQSRLIGQKARIDGGRIGDHPEPETRRPPAIGHGLTDIDHIQPPQPTFPPYPPMKPAPASGIVARLGWKTNPHTPTTETRQ